MKGATGNTGASRSLLRVGVWVAWAVMGAAQVQAQAPAPTQAQTPETATAGPAPASRAHAFEEGLRAYEARQFERAVQAWTEAAEGGSVAAAFNLGLMFEHGDGVRRDAPAAVRWYRLAAEGGDLSAQLALARLMETGAPGLKPEVEDARLWYGIALARPAADAEGQALQRQARERLAALPAAEVQMVPFTGGRYLFRGLAGGRCMIALQGRITPDTSYVFPRVVRRASEKGCVAPWIVLESGGGSLPDGLSLGREVHRAGYSTMVARACASACGLIFMGGRERILIGPEARIGLHQASVTRGGDPSTRRCVTDPVAPPNISIMGYLSQVNGQAFAGTLGIILTTSCHSMAWVSGQAALDLHIATAMR
ncbi:MAG: hypothetical protein ACOYLV_13625 [Rubrivivax sp.]